MKNLSMSQLTELTVEDLQGVLLPEQTSDNKH